MELHHQTRIMVKRILFIFTVICLFSCSSDNTSDSWEDKTPEFYNVKYEVVGTGMAYKIRYTTADNELVTERNIPLPYTKEFRLKTEIQGEDNTYGIETIYFWVYALEEVSSIQETRIFINGEQVDSDIDGPDFSPNGYETGWRCSFDYMRREP